MADPDPAPPPVTGMQKAISAAVLAAINLAIAFGIPVDAELKVMIMAAVDTTIPLIVWAVRNGGT